LIAEERASEASLFYFCAAFFPQGEKERKSLGFPTLTRPAGEGMFANEKKKRGT
jgi:hypothetical protein